MNFLAGDATGLCKEVVADALKEQRRVRVLKSGKQNRREAVRCLLFSDGSEEAAPRELTVGRASGWVEAFSYEILSQPPEKQGLEAFSAAPFRRPLRAFQLPSAPVSLNSLGSEQGRLNTSLYLTEHWLGSGQKAKSDFLPLSETLRNRLTRLESVTATGGNGTLLALGEAGHACVLEWKGEFFSRGLVDESSVVEISDLGCDEEDWRLSCSSEPVRFKPVPPFQSTDEEGGSIAKSPICSSVSSKNEEGAVQCRAAFMLPSPIEAAASHPLVDGWLAFGGMENDLKVFDLRHESLLWAARNSRGTVLRLRRPIHVTKVEWLLPLHPFVLLAGSAFGTLRLYDLRCQRRPVFELTDATLEARPITALCVRPRSALLKPGSSFSSSTLRRDRDRLFGLPDGDTGQQLAEARKAFLSQCTSGQEAVVYYGDSHGALYAKRFVCGEVLLRTIDKNVPKFNDSSFRSLEKSPAVQYTERESRGLLRKMLDAKRQKLSSRKNSGLLSACSSASHQFGCVPVGGFKDAVGAVTGLALSADGSRLLAVTLGRSAFIFDVQKRRLSLKVFLKQQLLCCLPVVDDSHRAPERPSGEELPKRKVENAKKTLALSDPSSLNGSETDSLVSSCSEEEVSGGAKRKLTKKTAKKKRRRSS